jgi:hypothetical protein
MSGFYRVSFVMIAFVLFLFVSIDVANAGFGNVLDKATKKADVLTGGDSAGGGSKPSVGGGGAGCKDVPCPARHGCRACCDKYVEIGYPESFASKDVDKKFKKVSNPKQAADGASAWLGGKQPKAYNKTESSNAGNTIKHQYCWPSMQMESLSVMKGYELGTFYNGKCSSEETATTAKCIQPLMQCWKGPSDSEFSCNFDLQSFMMEGGKCVPNPSRCNPNW